jgi:UDP-N-acetylmuramate dehydrogenase
MAGTRPEGIRERVALAPLTTLGVGGAARFFLDVTREDALAPALAWAKSEALPIYVLGGGSNVLVSDRGVDGLVIRLGLRGVRETESGLEVAAGEPLDGFIDHCVASGLAGLEGLSGIPGLVGATPIQNVGAYGQEIGERVVLVRAMDRGTGQVAVFDRSACRFSYRSSIFKEELRDRYLVLSVHLALAPGPAAPVRYPELERALAARNKRASSLADVRETVLSIRRAKSMVIDEADPNHRSAGSFFVNPVMDRDAADEVERRTGAGSAMPRFPSGERVKLSAAWLIERAGFAKGSGEGSVGISTNHALAIVNRGGASAASVLAFAARVRRTVAERFDVHLVPEPVLLGFTDEERAKLEGETSRPAPPGDDALSTADLAVEFDLDDDDVDCDKDYGQRK